jgi:hypothetical protein
MLLALKVMLLEIEVMLLVAEVMLLHAEVMPQRLFLRSDKGVQGTK